jgi:NAD/NADP transhydrogenase alpha subunit
MVEVMPSGGVTVDLAAASGGNIETTVPGELDVSYLLLILLII